MKQQKLCIYTSIMPFPFLYLPCSAKSLPYIVVKLDPTSKKTFTFTNFQHINARNHFVIKGQKFEFLYLLTSQKFTRWLLDPKTLTSHFAVSLRELDNTAKIFFFILYIYVFFLLIRDSRCRFCSFFSRRINLRYLLTYETRYKEYYYQKLALENRNFYHTPAYLATLLHSNTTKDVKELIAYIRKKCCKGFCCANFIIALKENVFIFYATFSAGWCISSGILTTFR